MAEQTLFPIESQTQPLDSVMDTAVATGGGRAIPFPYPDQPMAKTPPGPELPQIQSKGFGPIVPDTTKGVTAKDSPGALFTEDNMQADKAKDFLGEYADLAGEVKPMETVAGQLEKILAEDSPLFDWARGQAAMYANSRGLINSDIAAEASSNAVMAAALPIAQQDAATFAAKMEQERQFYYTAGLQAFDATIQSGLMAQAHLERMVEMTHQGDINSRLQLEQFGYNWQLNEQQNLHNMQLAALQGEIQAKLALQAFNFDVELMKQDYAYRIKLSDIELRNALRIGTQQHNQEMDRIALLHRNALEQIQKQADAQSEADDKRFSRDLQQNYLNAIERINISFNAEVTAIYSTPGLTSAQQNQAVNKAYQNYLNQLDFIYGQYVNSPHWDENWRADPMDMPTGGGGGGVGGGFGGGGTGGGGFPGDDYVAPTDPSNPNVDPTLIEGFLQTDYLYGVFGSPPRATGSAFDDFNTYQWIQRMSEHLGNYGLTYEQWRRQYAPEAPPIPDGWESGNPYEETPGPTDPPVTPTPPGEDPSRNYTTNPDVILGMYGSYPPANGTNDKGYDRAYWERAVGWYLNRYNIMYDDWFAQNKDRITGGGGGGTTQPPPQQPPPQEPTPQEPTPPTNIPNARPTPVGPRPRAERNNLFRGTLEQTPSFNNLRALYQ